MKRKGMILIIIGLIVVAYVLPLLWEVLNFRLGFFTICFGTGCSGSGGSQPGSPTPGTTWCSGYDLGFLCLSNKKEYCFYSSPFSMDKCLCEAVSNYEGRNVYRKFCPKNNLCYGNSFEYEFGCSEDLDKVCKRIESEISDATVEANYRCDSAHAYGIITSISQCSEQYIYIYENAENEQRKKIFNEGFIDRRNGQGASIGSICNLLCTNCNSSLCEQGNICEYAKFPPNTTKND